MNRKRIRIFEPGMRLYFFVMILFALVTVLFNEWVALAEGVIVLILFVYFVARGMRRRREIIDQVVMITSNVDLAGKDSVANFPLPTLIVRMDSDEVIWTNDKFQRISGDREHFFETKITDIVPDFSTRWLLEGKPECPSIIWLNERAYTIFGSIVKPEQNAPRSALIGTTYWMDVTEFIELKDRYAKTRPVVGIILLDNYDELVKNQTSSASAALLATIDDKIHDWTAFSEGLICKYDRDRYVIIFEESSLPAMIEAKFSLLDIVRETVNSSGIMATVSFGIGKDGASFAENYQYASLSIEMALSRGGDQAVIKNRYNFEFYGGRSKETEKRTTVKSRVMASALGELMVGASNVLIMGHSMADLDSVGAAVGVACITRKKGKEAKIVIDLEKNNSKALIAQVMKLPEYRNAFISSQEAMLLLDVRTLLVVVDTNRPEQVESQELLLSCNHVAVIDHHRRAATYIKNPALNFHEPHASSASELVTELMQYILDGGDILKGEAEALMAGIVLDTKNFTMRVGGRTFETAAFLRRSGADPTDVKKLMQNDFDSTVERYAIISMARVVRKGVSIAAVRRTVSRVIAAQAADELLTIEGIETSFVMYPDDTKVIISARSIGEINVQVIMEKLGGGGNNATAAAQLEGVTVDQALEMLVAVINDYVE